MKKKKLFKQMKELINKYWQQTCDWREFYENRDKDYDREISKLYDRVVKAEEMNLKFRLELSKRIEKLEKEGI